MQLRVVTDKDAEALSELNRAELTENYPLSDWQAILGSNPGLSFGVFDDSGQLVAYMLGMITMPFFLPILQKGHIASLAVSKRHRRQGHGEALLRAALKAMKDRGMKSCTLHVRTDNEAAKTLYAKMGFVTVYEQSGYYSDGQNAFYMEVHL